MDARSSLARRKYTKIVEEAWRPHGMLQPPQNPWLRPDELPTQRSRFWGAGPPPAAEAAEASSGKISHAAEVVEASSGGNTRIE